MNILLISGHTSGHNYSMNTKSNEGDLNIELTKLIASYLKEYADIDIYPYDHDAYHDRREGVYLSKYDYKKYKYILEIHFNSYDGSARGASVQLHSNYRGGISVEREIAKALSKYFKLRGDAGIITRDDLLNMNTALKQGVDYALLETCFHDNHKDFDTYQMYKNDIAADIVRAIAKGFGLTNKKTKYIYVQHCDFLNLRSNPGMDGEVIGILKPGECVAPMTYQPDSDGDYWLQVKASIKGKELTGFVWPEYVS